MRSNVEPIQLTFWSPVAAVFAAGVAFLWMRLGKRRGAPVAFPAFARYVFGWALTAGAGAFVAALLFGIVTDASTGPLGALFVFGPIGFTVGAIVGVGRCLATWHRA